MKAGEIYRTLSNEPSWSNKTRAVRWLASRYYAGVDTYYELQSLAHRSIACEKHGYITYVGPAITSIDVQEIIQQLKSLPFSAKLMLHKH
jgi:hypothetical protein